jgi:alkyl sulfatase BDS1-like metallo-beta-lactamase superfamily hydrolase
MKSCRGIYQVRGYDLANISFIKGDTGWIVFDPLTAKETARAALDFINEKLGKRPVVASCTRTPMAITSAACAAWSTRPTSPAARCW